MLLAAIPDSLKKDLISSITLSTTSILYKLCTTYQPGGSAERAFLLKQLTDTKAGATISKIKLTKYAESLGRLGGQQVAYRVATVCQELRVDLRPTLASIKEMADYIQAEAEELSLGLPPQKTTGGVTQAPSVKVLQIDQNDSLKTLPGLGALWCALETL